MSRTESFPYLPDLDRSFVDQAERPVGSVVIDSLGLTSGQEARVQELLASSLVVDIHGHPQYLPSDLGRLREYMRTGRLLTNYEGLRQSGITVMFDSLIGLIGVSTLEGHQFEDVVADLGMRQCDLAFQEGFVQARTVKDIHEAHAAKKIAFVFATESAGFIGSNLDRLDILYGFGVRSMGLTHNEANGLASGLAEPGDGGLTLLGRAAVRRMNELGMIVDIAHAGDQSGMDAIRYSQAPVIISHAGSRTVWNTPRMKPDDVIRACVEGGGLIGIEAAPHSTISTKHPEHSLHSVMDHFEYLVDLVGIEGVTFGPDCLYGDHVGLHHALADLHAGGIPTSLQPEHPVTYVDGMDNATEAFPNVVRYLVHKGYSDHEIRQVISGNSLRVMSAVWGQ